MSFLESWGQRLLGWLRMAALLAMLPGAALAEGQLEVLTLQHSTVEQVLPVLRPMVSPGGVISGYNGKLMIRTDPANLAQLRAILAEIDAPAVRLLVSVSRQAEARGAGSTGEVSGSIGSGDVRVTRSPSSTAMGTSRIEFGAGGSRVQVSGSSGSASRGSRVTQQIQTVNGGQAYIQAGVSVPVNLRQAYVQPGGGRVVQGTVFRDLGSGFYARPQLIGDRVRIAISPFAAQPAVTGTGVRVEELETTIEGRLGEWIALGGSHSAGQSTQDGRLQGGRQEGSQESGLWLKVDRLP